MKRLLACRELIAIVVVVLGLSDTGCGPKGPPTLEVAPVTGTVTMDGQPLADATVNFLYDGTPPDGFYGSAGTTDASGKYELKSNAQPGAVPGKYKVTVSKLVDKDGKVPKADPAAGMDLEQMIQGGAVKETVPTTVSDPSQTQKTAEVVAGKDNVIDIEIP